MDIKDQVADLAKQIAELRAMLEQIHQAVAAAPRYRG